MEDSVEPGASSDSKICLTDHVMPVPIQNVKDTRYFHLLRYFQSQQMLVFDKKSKTQRERTGRMYFTLFNGGTVLYTLSQRDRVLQLLGEDLKSETPMFYNQVGYEDEGFRLVVDIDSQGPLTFAEERRLIELLEATLRRYYRQYGENPIPIYVAQCKNRLKKTKLTTSLHMIAHVMVTLEQAKQILHAYDLCLKREVPELMQMLTVDSGIYKEGTASVWMRFIYCYKVDECPLCGGDPAKCMSCLACGGKGKVCSKQTYVPALYSCGDGPVAPEEFARLHSSFHQMACDYSVWVLKHQERRTDYERPATDPVYQVQEAEEKKRAKAVKGKRTGAPPLSGANPAYEMVEEILHKIIWLDRKPWEGISVDRIVVSSARRALISVSNLGSTYCLYVNKDHTSNRVYFILDNVEKKLVLMCHSDHDPACKDKHKRISFSVPDIVCQKVFGTQAPPNPLQLRKTQGVSKGTESFDSFLKRKMTEEEDPKAKQERLKQQAKRKKLEALGALFKVPS